jgi:hypothetical protein
VPFQMNYDTNMGEDNDGDQYYMNFQPVIPITLNEDWNVISRTIVPLIHQEDIFPGTGASSGVGNILQSLFFSPQRPTKWGITWGVGPAIQMPTASTERFGPDQWALGPTLVALKQTGPWTIGMLTNQLWSVSGNHDEPNSSATFLQPFLSYTTKTAWTYQLNSESTYNYKSDRWSVPLNFTIQHVTHIGGQLINIGAGARYWAMSPRGGAEDWGARLIFTLLFPKHH